MTRGADRNRTGLKTGGIAPIVMLTRPYALAGGAAVRSTLGRQQDATALRFPG
jgi:signal-transduction protein with cAMP-binding, CBS, and nucleotidyltransferase domain